MPMERRIIEGVDKYIIVEPTPKHKIDNAFKIVYRAIDGKYGFAWRDIYKYKYKHPDDRVRDTFRTDEQCKALQDKLHTQHQKLKSALNLLHHEGYVDSYTCLNSGRLTVSFFEMAVRIELEILDESFLKKLQIFHDSYGQTHQRILEWWRYYPGNHKPKQINSLVARTRKEYEYQTARVHQRTLERQKELWAESHDKWLGTQRRVNRSRRLTKLDTTGANIF
jgi:hypothetical protein